MEQSGLHPEGRTMVLSESEVRAGVNLVDKRRIFGLQEIAGIFQAVNRNPSKGDLPLQVSN